MTLQLQGGRTIRADDAIVWAALHDVGCLKACVPGCLSLQRSSARRFDLSVLVPLGPVSIAFAGHVDILESTPRRRLLLGARGDGGLAGLAAGTADLSLAETAGGCRLDYVIEAEPAGPFSAVGAMLLSGLARSLCDAFGSAFAAQVGRPVLASPAAPVVGLPLSTF